MVGVAEQYEAYPYPERDPGDERKRLITGSPSDPAEMDHHLWAGRRDWSQPLRALVAGGGTGDGLIQLAQKLADAGRPAEITYIDLSAAARGVAEARAAVRGLDAIRFLTGSLLDAPALGPFDYIDCCGVLHHLQDPAAGLSALKAALAPGGGMGFMVYAPYGRSGVYPLQEAFAALFDGLPPAERLVRAREVLDRVPEGHPFRRNPHLGDHRQSAAGFYDLLLHGQDRAFAVDEVQGLFAETGWSLAGMTMPGLYDLSAFVAPPPGLSPDRAMAVAERLQGTIKTHVGYAVAAEEARAPAAFATLAGDSALVPHLSGAAAAPLAEAVARGRDLPLTFGATKVTLRIDAAAAPLIARIDGRRTLAEIARSMPEPRFAALWSGAERALTAWGMLRYSGVLRQGPA